MVHVKFLLHEGFLNIWKKSVVFSSEILPLHFSTDTMEHYYESPPNIPKALVTLSVHYVEINYRFATAKSDLLRLNAYEKLADAPPFWDILKKSEFLPTQIICLFYTFLTPQKNILFS
jgi:hypothetical protein